MTKAEKYMLRALTALSSPCCDLATAFSREEDEGLQKGFFLLRGMWQMPCCWCSDQTASFTQAYVPH